MGNGFKGMDSFLIHGINKKKTGAVVQPIVPAVAYSFPDHDSAIASVSGEQGTFYYGRYGNETLKVLEGKIAALENGEAALGVGSGMAAITTALLTFLQSGDHVIVTQDVYGGTYKFLTTLGVRFGISYSFVDCTNPSNIIDAIKSNTKAIYIETPSNPLLTVLDIRGIAKITRDLNIPLIVDNTFMSPYLQKPLDLGADVVVHSATKYLNGHGDVLAGFVVGKEETIQFMRKNIMGDLGQVLSAWDAFLILRGLKTLGLRMKQHCLAAEQIASFLEKQKVIEKVYYPGLKSHPQFEIARKNMKGMGGIVSFEVKGGFQAAQSFLNALQFIMISFSLGDPETLIQHPATMTHSSMPVEERLSLGITDGLIRLSVGLEDVNDIIQDLEQALHHIKVEEFEWLIV